MKLNLLKYRTKSLLKHNKASRANLPYRQAHSVGIVFTSDDRAKHDEIKEFIKRLEQDGKQVKVISFLPKDKENFEFLFDFFGPKDVNFWGQITSENALKFADQPFDFLFYVDEIPNPLILHLVARSKAECRVSRHWEKTEPYFELMIESTPGVKSLINGMIRYTTKLR
jgi:hypothetical protein